ncbi:hypothetical protein AX14_013657 [Amanita brunnescens Koide BX004]|nr:hypothetical protein AX14_013657 [Amanita brunnescens Koide BX004]
MPPSDHPIIQGYASFTATRRWIHPLPVKSPSWQSPANATQDDGGSYTSCYPFTFTHSVNIYVRPLAEIVSKSDFIQYPETIVPKPLIKEWNSKYDRLTQLVVPRSSLLSRHF